MTTQKLISRCLIGLAIGFGFVWAVPALADTPVPPGPGVTIDVTGVAEPYVSQIPTRTARVPTR